MTCEKTSTGMYGTVMNANGPVAHHIQPSGLSGLYMYGINQERIFQWIL